jgi:Tol biopolymer transport system component
MVRIIRCAAGLLAIGAALDLGDAEPVAFLTAPQRDRQFAVSAPASVDVSADGRYVAFESYARLVPADGNDQRDVYVLDRQTRRVTLESTTATGALGDAGHPRLSGDGRFLVFESRSVVTDDGAGPTQIVLCDRVAATSKVVSTGADGAPGNGSSREPDVSDDGRTVVFSSNATNLVAGRDENGREEDVYAFDVRTGVMQRVSVNSTGSQPAGASASASVSGDGRWVAFAASGAAGSATGSSASPSGRRDPKLVLVRDLVERTTTPVSALVRGSLPDGDSWAPSISHDGRFVAFVSNATNLGGGARNHEPDVFLQDLQTSTLTLVSRTVSGEDANGTSGRPSISADGRFVAFQSDASNLVCAKRCSGANEDINLLSDVFVFDRERTTVVRVSGDEAGGWMEASRGPALDGSGRVLAFSSRHPTDALDRADDYDLFVTIDPER